MPKVTEISHKGSLADRMRKRLSDNESKGVKIHTYSDENPIQQIKDWIPLGKFFESASGGKGFPCGHITQLIGKTDSGKSTLMMKGMVECQKAGGVVYLLEPEHKFDFNRFEIMGGEKKDLIYVEINSLEDAWNFLCNDIIEAARELREEGIESPVMVAWDSIPTTVPNKILDEKDAGDAHFALEAKINNKNIRKLRQAIKSTSIACVFINHYYMSQPTNPYERSEVVIKGGEEMGFLSTLIILMKRGRKITRDITQTINGKKVKKTQEIGRISKVEIIKGHFHGRKIVEEISIVGPGIIETDEELKEYKNSLRGKI